MATWRCPHCGTPQAEGSRCWVCSRSPLTCTTCRHFRRGVVARVGYCAMDRLREPLNGDEVRACWQPPAASEPMPGLFETLELPAPPVLEEPPVPAPVTVAPHRPEPRPVPPPAAARPTPMASRRQEPPQRNAPVAMPGRPSANGRLVEAPTVAASGRLGYHGDPRSLREASLAADAREAGANPPSAHREVDGGLDGAAIRQ